MNTSIEVEKSKPVAYGEELLHLRNANGLQAELTPFGASLVRLLVPDGQGQMRDVVLGFDSLESYKQPNAHFGGIIGRYANRIRDGHFLLDRQSYELTTNAGPHALHGGHRGFDLHTWNISPEHGAVVFSRRSPHGEEGYPGTLDVQVRYSLTDRDELMVSYSATCDRATVVNLTHHSYFRLSGAASHDILDHELTVFADAFTLTDAANVPTGQLAHVKDSPLDFRQARRLGEVIGHGLDHNYVLGFEPGLKRAASLFAAASGLRMDVFTDQPGLQVYTGNFLDGTIRGKGGEAYRRFAGICLETQNFPDAPNHAHFPSAVLRPGQLYQTTTIYKFTKHRSSNL